MVRARGTDTLQGARPGAAAGGGQHVRVAAHELLPATPRRLGGPALHARLQPHRRAPGARPLLLSFCAPEACEYSQVPFHQYA